MSLFLGILLFIFSNTQEAKASAQNSFNELDSKVIEYLIIKVPKKNKDAWIKAEKDTWEPWLRNQNGFIDRQMLWNKNKEEALLLITWSSKDKWKSIPQEEINNVQKNFEDIARKTLGINSGNPFPLKYEGELIPQ